ncbi:zinc finger, CCHC-type containing protein [Tanacetum coccineum]
MDQQDEHWGWLNTWTGQQEERANWMYDHTVRQFQHLSTRDNLDPHLQIDLFPGRKADYPPFGYHGPMPPGFGMIEIHERGDGVAITKRWCQDFHGDGVTDLTTASGRSRLKAALEDSTRRTLIILAAFRPSLGPQNPIVTDLDPCFNQILLILLLVKDLPLALKTSQKKIKIGHRRLGKRECIERIPSLLEGNNVVPLLSETIRLVQNECSFHGLRSEDPNQHLKDFLKLVDSLDLDVANRERTRLRLFQFSLRNQASNWLECLPAGSISTWEDLTTRFLAQFFPPGRTAKLHNDILMVQQHQGECLFEAWTRFKDLLQKYCMENPEQAFVEYASSCTDEAGDARLSKFEADFKQQQSEMTNKIDTVLKAITDQITGALPSDTVKNLKLNVNSTNSQFCTARSYPTEDPQ